MSDIFEALVDLLEAVPDLPIDEKGKPRLKVFVAVVFCIILGIILLVNHNWYDVQYSMLLGVVSVSAALVLAIATILILYRFGKLYNISIEWFLLLTVLCGLIYATGLLFLNYKMKIII